MRKFVVLALVLGASLLWAPMAYADPSTSPTESAVTQRAVDDIASQLNGKKAKLEVKTFKTSGVWAFLDAKMKEPNGDPFSYARTPLEVDAAHGAASGNYVGLFREGADGTWQVIKSRVGPTDVAWVGWDKQYGAPSDLFPQGVR